MIRTFTTVRREGIEELWKKRGKITSPESRWLRSEREGKHDCPGVRVRHCDSGCLEKVVDRDGERRGKRDRHKEHVEIEFQG